MSKPPRQEAGAGRPASSASRSKFSKHGNNRSAQGGGAGPRRSAAPANADGLIARDVAASALFSVFVENRAFDDVFAKAAEARSLAPRDRAFARMIATTVLRHRGPLNAVVNSFLERPLPQNRGRLEPILLCAAAQLLILNTPPHAAISLAVDQCRADREAQRFDKLANAVLRKVATQGAARLAEQNAVALTVPAWMMARWVSAYGADVAHAIALASLQEPALDLTTAGAPEPWAERYGGHVLAAHTARIPSGGRIEDLDGYREGAWWVQDVAAALPATLFADVRDRDVADLCAAPGGKTAQLAAAGARVTAVDKSHGRLRRLQENLARLGLTADTAVADAATFAPGKTFDAVLIDAPCTATGTIRRHPDILYLKRPEDVAALAAVQHKILRNAAALVRPGGQLIYCTCSLEVEEGAQQIEAFLADVPGFAREPVQPAELMGHADWLTPAGDVRTLPCHLSDLPEGLRGMDGFFVTRLRRAE